MIISEELKETDNKDHLTLLTWMTENKCIWELMLFRKEEITRSQEDKIGHKKRLKYRGFSQTWGLHKNLLEDLLLP